MGSLSHGFMTSKWRYFGQSVLTVLSVVDLCVGCRRE